MIAVVGGTGVIGAGIVRALRSAGQEAIVVTHNPRRAGEEGVRYGDIRHPETLPAAIRGATTLVQSANFPNYPFERPRRGDTFMTYDGAGTEQLTTAARRAGVRRYVFISGAGTRPDSGRPYFDALQRGQDAVLNSGLESVCIGPTLVYGPRDHGLNRILRAARAVPVLPELGGSQLHQPVFIDDVAGVAARACELGAPQGVFEIGGPERMALDDLVTRALAVAGLQRRVVHVPVGLARFGATFLEALPAQPLTRAAVAFLAEDFVADLTALNAAYPVELTPLERGLRTYIGGDQPSSGRDSAREMARASS
jgi:NADH dehydrogenase